ncbi:alpha/beta fold hydrolase [Youngiibacter fragilis]|uniref:AB hydrolase-1 domain-containing protein n=1 Tax=Youngiibacter fragilis 232.1 TaxID=994573 RepID=V7I2R1_9CLOT|nr:alpha/beta fold hydrolase [Youngiibacter fragilis]ETA79479.1 hypothetical protein T472_0216810 [Youngiibacter fragilis 232.1]
MKDKTKGSRFFAITTSLLLFFTILIWGFQSDWGQIKIRRLTLIGNDGIKISALAYIPVTATNESKAPGILINHGRSNHAHSNDTWSMELARRGYVVISPDLSGGGESDITNRSAQSVVWAKYLQSLDIVDAESINLIGYSAGCGTSLDVAKAMPDSIRSLTLVFGPFMAKISGHDLTSFKNQEFGIIKALEDQYDFNFLGNPAASRSATAKMFGISEDIVNGGTYALSGGKNLTYIEVDGALHQTGNISGSAISSIVGQIGRVAPAPLKLEQSDQAWVWQQVFSGAACVTILFWLASMINLLMQNPFFATIGNDLPAKKPIAGLKAWSKDILFSVMIPILLFIPVSAYGMAWTANSKVLTANALTGIMCWLLVIAAISTVRMVIRHRKSKKEGSPLSLGSYALGADGTSRIDWSKPAKALLIGIICVTAVFVWLAIIESVLGINYQVWNLSTYLKLSPARFIRAIPYVLIIFTVMLVGNMNQRILPSTGNERKDMWIAVGVNSFLTATALFILLLVQYGGSLMIGTGETLIPQMDLGLASGTSVGALDFAFGYCYMMGGTTGIVTYIYRKYGNIWAGVIPAAIFAGLVTTAGFTLMR